MIIRTIRDIYTSEIDAVWIDEPEPSSAPASS